MTSTTPPPPCPLNTLRKLEVRAGRESAIPDEPLISSVITLGNFDGIHVAHKVLLETVVSEARGRGLPSVVITFFPHPAQFLRPDSGFKLLMPIEERARQIETLGVDRVIALRFGETVAKMSAETFVQDLLVGAFHPALLVIGPDTRFGRDRRGDANLLTQIGAQQGFEVMPLDTMSLDGQRVSSSGIRQCLKAGDVETPRNWCNAPFQVEGRVVHGSGRGRQLGFRTANLEIGWPTLPAAGVYVVRCAIEGKGHHYGVANLGTRPTFEDPDSAPETLEVHLLEEKVQNLYGKTMRVGFLRRLRDEMRFTSSDALVAQIKNDVSAALQFLEKERP